MTSGLVTWLKDDFSIDEAVDTEYFNLTTVWNDFVDAWNEDYDWVSGNLFGGTKITLVKLEVNVEVPININIPFFGDIGLWDFVISFMYFKTVGMVTVFGFSLPIGVMFYWITKDIRVPFFGSDDLIPLVQSGPTKFGGINPGFTVKDASYDITKFWILAKLMKMIGPRGIALLMQAIFFINSYRQPKLKDVILRISPSGSSFKFDDDSELSLNEKLNWMINYVDAYMAFLLDPLGIPRPQVLTDEELKEEPNIGV